MVRRGAGEPKACDLNQPTGASARRTTSTRRVLRAGQVLGDADAQLPRRPRQHVRRLRRVGPGLDRDKGLSDAAMSPRPATSQWPRRPPARVVARPRLRIGALLRPARLAGGRLPRLADRPLHRVVLVARTSSRRLIDRSLSFDNLRDDPHRAGVPADRLADGLDRRAGDDHRHRAGVPDRLLHGAGRARRARRRCSSSRC